MSVITRLDTRLGINCKRRWDEPFVVSFNPLANEVRLQIRDSWKRDREGERNGVYSKNLSTHPRYDTGLWEARKIENSSLVRGIRGKPISKCRFHFRNPWQFPHCRITRSWFDPISLRSISIRVLDALHFRNTFFFSFFLRRERSNSFRSYCPASPGSRDTFGKVDHLESLSWLLLNFITLLENILLDILRPTSSKNFPSRKFTF